MTLPPPPNTPPPNGASPPPPFGGSGPYPQSLHQPWPQQPSPRRSGTWKWVLAIVALLAVVGVTAAVTVAVTGEPTGGGLPSASTPQAVPSDSEIASAEDSGGVSVITDDPTCAPQRPIVSTLAAKTNAGWDKRDPEVPASDWTPEIRAQYNEVAAAMRDAADQFVQLAKLTPHRVMREIYEQFIAYARAYAASVPNYTPGDDYSARFAVGAAEAISRICAAIDYGSAGARAPLVKVSEPPAEIAPVGDANAPVRFLSEPNAVCRDWNLALMQFQDETAEWRNTDPKIPAGEWTPEQKRLNVEVAPVMRRFATQLRSLGNSSGNPVLADFANLSAQYRSALEKALPTYVPADDYLAGVSARLNGMVNSACKAVSA